MNTQDILLYLLIGLTLFIFLRKFLRNKKVKHYSAIDLSQVIKKNKNTLLLDVRTKAERDSQKINGSIHIPLHELKTRVEELKKYKDKEIVCYCQTGSRSVSAAIILQKSGFNIANLRGGILGWNSAGLR
ncbi:MAG: rhodanese-like domain-containing protein [Ignavibacteriales bacterium]|nr:MAG: rhodanese-like domain-containing protein [Ignavibacteriales bacterium]